MAALSLLSAPPHPYPATCLRRRRSRGLAEPRPDSSAGSGLQGPNRGQILVRRENSPLQGFRLDKCSILIVSRKAPGSPFWVGYSVLGHVIWTRFRNGCEGPGRLSPGQSAPPCPLPSALRPPPPCQHPSLGPLGAGFLSVGSLGFLH